MLTWKIVVPVKVSILYIYIDNNNVRTWWQVATRNWEESIHYGDLSLTLDPSSFAQELISKPQGNKTKIIKFN